MLLFVVIVSAGAGEGPLFAFHHNYSLADSVAALCRPGIAHTSAPNATITGKHSITYRGSTVCSCVIASVRIATNRIKNVAAICARYRHHPTAANPRYAQLKIPNPRVTPKSAGFPRHLSPGGHNFPE